MVKPLIDLLKEHSLPTYHHCVRVAELAARIAEAMGHSERDQRVAYYCGLFHDIGKLKVTDRILTKPLELNAEEWRAIRKYPIFGYQLLKHASPAFKDIKYTVLFHRERNDGSGYPFKLKKEDIPVIARIVAVADSFDAMTLERVYRRAKSEAAAFEQLRQQQIGGAFDPSVIDGLQLYLENKHKQARTAHELLV